MAPPPKKPRGRPRNDGQPPKPTETLPNAHHYVTAQPSQLGRHGRMIRGGIGSRGGGRGTRGRGRGQGTSNGAPSSSKGIRVHRASTRGRGRGIHGAPIGVGVLMASDGSCFINSLGGSGLTLLDPSSQQSN